MRDSIFFPASARGAAITDDLEVAGDVPSTVHSLHRGTSPIDLSRTLFQNWSGIARTLLVGIMAYGALVLLLRFGQAYARQAQRL